MSLFVLRFTKVKGKAVPLSAKHAQKGGMGVVLPILDPGARRVQVVSVRPPHPRHLQESDLVPFVCESHTKQINILSFAHSWWQMK
jgi:hypothetical protein